MGFIIGDGGALETLVRYILIMGIPLIFGLLIYLLIDRSNKLKGSLSKSKDKVKGKKHKP